MSLGHRGASTNPAAILNSLIAKRGKLQEELRNVEKQVYELETSYLQESSHMGNAFKGFEGFLSSSKNTSNLKRSRKFQPEDRMFSLSSVTSPAAEELGGSMRANGQGEPKKRRTSVTLKEVKRIRPEDEENDRDNELKITLSRRSNC